ncbi:hypothetical protein ACLBWT_18755 [Paenibacillus sp. D51F]
MAQKSFNHISDELRDKINSYISASGLNDKEWIDRAVEVWELHALKNEIPDFRMEIEEVEGLTNRIRNVLVNLAQRTAFEKIESKRQSEEVLEEKRLIIEQLNADLLDAERTKKSAQEEADRQRLLREEAEKYANQVDQSSESNRALAESYKEKNASLTDLVAQYKNGYEESQSLRAELAESRRLIEGMEKELTGERERHRSEMERAIERRDVEHERELLRIRTEHQTQLQATVKESTAEIRGLYDRMEHIRADYEQRLSVVVQERDGLRSEMDRVRKGEHE